MSLTVATVLIVGLNFLLIPNFGVRGAIIAGVCSIGTVVCLCVAGLRRYISPLKLLFLAIRQAIALGATAVVFVVGRYFGMGAWLDAIAECCGYPLEAFAAGLVLSPSSSSLFKPPHAPPAASPAPGQARTANSRAEIGTA